MLFVLPSTPAFPKLHKLEPKSANTEQLMLVNNTYISVKQKAIDKKPKKSKSDTLWSDRESYVTLKRCCASGS